MFQVESQGAVDVIAPSVSLNTESIEQLADTIEQGLSEGQPMVVLDMSDVQLIDSSGLETLLDAQQALRLKGGAIKLACLSQLCKDVLRVTGVSEQFDTFRDVKEAVRSYLR